MSLICSWRNNKYTFVVQLFCSRLASVWIVAWHLPGSCFQSPFWGLEMEESIHSGIVPMELGHIWDIHEDPLSWKCSWGFCRLVQEVCALQWSHVAKVLALQNKPFQRQPHPYPISYENAKERKYSNIHLILKSSLPGFLFKNCTYCISFLWPAGIQKWVILLPSLVRTVFPN